MKQKVQVHMLPTDSINQVKEGNLFINDSREYNWGKLQALMCERVTAHGHAWNGSGIQTNIKHLYFTSDEKIKEGDWFIDSVITSNISVKKSRNLNDGSYYNSEFCRKIIATTDKSLSIFLEQSGDNVWSQQIPQISQEFLKEYCKANGKIDEVEIEIGNGINVAEKVNS